MPETTLYNNIINRANFVIKDINATFRLELADGALCQALCEELERVYERIEKLEAAKSAGSPLRF